MVNKSMEKIIKKQILDGYSDEEISKFTASPILLVKDLRKQVEREFSELFSDTGPEF